MPASWKCSQCGLINFASDATCKRCGALAQPSQIPATPPVAGIVLEDGYVLPPPPSLGGVWREQSTLVMTKDATLPDNCVKCDAPANGFRLKRTFSWHHPALYVLILIAWLIYLIIALAVRKQATVYLGLCQEHYQRRRNFLIVGWVALAAGILLTILAFSSDYPAFGLFGILIFLISVIWLAFVARVVNVKKIDDRFVWLTGLNENFLARFPSLPQ